MSSLRKQHIITFYKLINELEDIIGGRRYLRDCNGIMEWPDRGVYFFFEEGEHLKDQKGISRVVRVGTHAITIGAQATLWQRLRQHKGNENGNFGENGGNHRGSIFRKLLGEAIINNENLKCDTWGEGSNAPVNTREREHFVEEMVSHYIRNEMPFIFLEINDDPNPTSGRALIERNSIALLSNFEEDSIHPPSEDWLGYDLDRDRVQKSGLWNQNHVDETYDQDFLVDLKKYINNVKN